MQGRIFRLVLAALILTLSGAFAAPAAAQGATAQVTRRSTPAYVGPGTGFYAPGSLNQNEIVPILGRSADGQFWQVNTAFGVVFVLGRDVNAANAGGVPTVAVLTYATVTRNTTLRDNPGPGGSRLATLTRGTQGYLDARTPNGLFVYIRTASGNGWVSLADTAVAGDLAAVAAIPVPTARVTAGFLNVRTGPGLIYAVIGTLSNGDVVEIVGRSTDNLWLQVRTGVGDGWINSIYAYTENYFGNAPDTQRTTRDAALAPVLVTVYTGSLNVRTGPNVGFASLGAVRSGTRLPVFAISPDGGWYYVESPFGMGWISSTQSRVQGDAGALPVRGQ